MPPEVAVAAPLETGAPASVPAVAASPRSASVQTSPQETQQAEMAAARRQLTRLMPAPSRARNLASLDETFRCPAHSPHSSPRVGQPIPGRLCPPPRRSAWVDDQERGSQRPQFRLKLWRIAQVVRCCWKATQKVLALADALVRRGRSGGDPRRRRRCARAAVPDPGRAARGNRAVHATDHPRRGVDRAVLWRATCRWRKGARRWTLDRGFWASPLRGRRGSLDRLAARRRPDSG